MGSDIFLLGFDFPLLCPVVHTTCINFYHSILTALEMFIHCTAVVDVPELLSYVAHDLCRSDRHVFSLQREICTGFRSTKNVNKVISIAVLTKSIKCYTDCFKDKKIFFRSVLDSINYLQKYFENFGLKF